MGTVLMVLASCLIVCGVMVAIMSMEQTLDENPKDL